MEGTSKSRADSFLCELHAAAGGTRNGVNPTVWTSILDKLGFDSDARHNAVDRLLSDRLVSRNGASEALCLTFAGIDRAEELAAKKRPRRVEDPLPTTAAEIREEISYWAEHLSDGAPGSDHWVSVESRLANLRHLELVMGKRVPATPDTATPRPSKKHPWLPDQWMIEKQLSEGGQGWTYLVRRSEEPSGELYVFKRLKNQGRTGRLEAEIKALTLSHPGILKIVDSGMANESPYYVAEYCSNGDLSKWNPPATSLLQKLMLYRQICDAIAAAHQAGILHRDIKPSNILIRLDASVAVGDFGLCLHLTDADDRLTATSEAVGARNYIPPEWEDGRAPDPRPSGDVYSLGKLLYFMLSGRSLSREKHRSEPHNLLLSEASGIDPGLYFVYDLLDKTIAANPEDRYQNAAELRDALDVVIMKIEKNANVLDMKVRQQCVYCIEGHYRPMEGSGDQHSLRLVCSNCGNIQHFTRQYTGARSWWMKS